ncbi:hypothetical protein MTO96_031400, partial [Rhipicephalus appendiculatus]
MAAQLAEFFKMAGQMAAVFLKLRRKMPPAGLRLHAPPRPPRLRTPPLQLRRRFARAPVTAADRRGIGPTPPPAQPGAGRVRGADGMDISRGSAALIRSRRPVPANYVPTVEMFTDVTLVTILGDLIHLQAGFASGVQTPEDQHNCQPFLTTNLLTARLLGKWNRKGYIPTMMGCNVSPLLALICWLHSGYITVHGKTTDPKISDTRQFLGQTGDIYLVGLTGVLHQGSSNPPKMCLRARYDHTLDSQVRRRFKFIEDE